MLERTEMNSDEIKSLVKKSENAAVEFKRARGGVSADFWPRSSRWIVKGVQ